MRLGHILRDAIQTHYLIAFPSAVYESSRCSMSLPVLGIVSVLNFSQASRRVLVSHRGVNLHFVDDYRGRVSLFKSFLEV